MLCRYDLVIVLFSFIFKKNYTIESIQDIFPLKGILLSEAVLTLANCAGYTLCKKTRFPWKRHVISYERPCSGEEIINSTVSPVFLEESFVQLRNNYMTSLYELSWQIQNLTLFAVSGSGWCLSEISFRW